MRFSRTFARKPLYTVSLSYYFLTLVTLSVKLYGIKWISFQRTKIGNMVQFSYLGQDYPTLWMPHISYVQQIVESGANRHYALTGEDAGAEWAGLTPNNGIIYLGDGKLPFSLSMFHQLRCLNILRISLAETSIPSALDKHCLNYLRQMILCQADLTLEMEVRIPGEEITFLERRMCKNWAEVYKRTKENQAGMTGGN